MQQITVLDKTFSIHLTDDRLQQRISKMGTELYADYRDKEPLFLGVLNGAFVFAADLLKSYEGTCRVSFVKLASYHGTESTGKVNSLIGLNGSLEGEHVIVLEDIVDSGITLQYLLSQLNELHPASVKVAALLSKPAARKVEVDVHYTGFEVENDFLIGYGLDYNGYGRNLKHIYKLKN